MRTVIADTSALYALVDADDTHHAEAVAFLRREGNRLLLVVTDLTLFETMTLIKSRLGHAVAARALRAIQTSTRYRLIVLTDQDRTQAWRLFDQYADKDWSPFDCACLAASQARKIREAFAFDQHCDQMMEAGLKRVP